MTFDPNNTAARYVGYAMRRTPVGMRKALLIAALKHISAALVVLTSKEEAAMELYAVGDGTIRPTAA